MGTTKQVAGLQSLSLLSRLTVRLLSSVSTGSHGLRRVSDQDGGLTEVVEEVRRRATRPRDQALRERGPQPTCGNHGEVIPERTMTKGQTTSTR